MDSKTVRSTSRKKSGIASASAPGLSAGFRPEIQAIRALAVSLVVLYHLWPQILTGGFVGVDVFFVVSGYLITGHLVREQERTGRIRLAEFWARRARRLLPASLLVLFLSALLVLGFVPQIFWAQFFRETIASALYTENWVLASDAVNYLATNNTASAAQHYWSLSVEEQFYIVWPLLLVAVGLIAARITHADRRKQIIGTLAVITVASFAFSVFLTATNPAAAYFVTPVRGWEFGAGGLLAITRQSNALKATWLKSLVSWLGWAALIVVSISYSASTPFPGSAALVPVGATLAIIWSSTPAGALSPARIIGTRPVQWLGDISYSTYLWHWPLIIIAPYVLGYAQLAFVEKSGILLITLAFAWLTKRWVEDPIRSGPLLTSRRVRVTLIAAVAAIVIVVVPSTVGDVILEARATQQSAAREKLAHDPCFGAPSLLSKSSCSNAMFSLISPDPALAPEDSPHVYFTQPPCFAAGTTVRSCVFGDLSGAVRVALIGDSHAAQWEPALEIVARKRHWQLTTYLKTNCAFTETTRTAQYSDCRIWTQNVSKLLDRQKPYQAVIMSSFAQNLNLEISAGSVTSKSAIDGFRDVWAPLARRGSTVVVLHDTPHMASNSTVCVALHGASPQCNLAAAAALSGDDPEYDAGMGVTGVRRLNLSNYFCDSRWCFAVIGGVAVRTDPFHMTQTYSKSTARFLESALAAVMTLK